MSRIEQIIDDIANYVEECKPYPLSSTKIVVNKEELIELIEELRQQIPDEVKAYQKIISNQDAIIDQAKREASGMVQEASVTQAQMVDEHEIMQKAYSRANSVIEDAQNQAQMIINKAETDAGSMKRSIIKYSDDMLGTLQQLMEKVMEDYKTKSGTFLNSIQSDLDIVLKNREELSQANMPDDEDA